LSNVEVLKKLFKFKAGPELQVVQPEPETELEIVEPDQEEISVETFTPEVKEELIQRIPEEVITKTEWDSLFRSVQDGGANSILACHILKKSMDLLASGNDQVIVMVDVAKKVQQDTVELKTMTESIKSISKASRMVSINLAIEAAHFEGQGAAFNIVAEEMRRLSDQIAHHSDTVENKIQMIQDRTKINEAICEDVSRLFSNTNSELIQFRNIMMRIEELSVSQNDRLRNLKDKIEKN
jgi:hypothetical protein